MKENEEAVSLQQSSVLVDQPIETNEKDTLSRNAFVKTIASMLKLPSDSASIVIGLEGKWGSGKTSCINLVKKDLESDGVIVVPYNPWLVSALDSLLSGFFVQFATAIGRRTEDTNLQKAAKQILEYGKLLTPMKLVPGVEPWGTMVESIFAPGMTAIAQQTSFNDWDLSTQKSALEESIKNLNKHVVVVVDDLDRLPPDEIRTVFQLIKAISDFHGVAYLVAYDVDIVSSALGFDNSESGRAYLEKIVQIPCPLPRLSMRNRKQLFRDMVLNELESHPSPNKKKEKEQVEEFLEKTDAGVLISTPRELVRLQNRICFQRHWSGREVLFGDVVGFELLALLFPKCVEYMIEHWESFMTTAIPNTETISDTLVLLDVAKTYSEDETRNAKERDSMFAETIQRCYSPDEISSANPNKRIVLESLIQYLFPASRGQLEYPSMRSNSPRRIDKPLAFLKVVQGSSYDGSLSITDCYSLIENSSNRSAVLRDWRNKKVAVEKLALSAHLLDDAELKDAEKLASAIISSSPPDEASAVQLILSKLIFHVREKDVQEKILIELLDRTPRLDLAGRVIFGCLETDDFTRQNGVSGYLVNVTLNLGYPSEELRTMLVRLQGEWCNSVKKLLERELLDSAPPCVGVILALYTEWQKGNLDKVQSFIAAHLDSEEFFESLMSDVQRGPYPFIVPSFFPNDFNEQLGKHHPEHTITRQLKHFSQ